ncbi:MAG: DUF4835 family protein [Sphingobacteriaceae bacterium]|nr:DUF4835 family protein [Sphingobacteriaceae bacterium]
MKKIILLFALILNISTFSFAQELNARVQINAPNNPNIPKQNLEKLQNTIKEFINTNKWTDETTQVNERIDCNFVITIKSWDGAAEYVAEAIIQSSRPIYGTTYNTTILNINDKDFNFKYNEGEIIEFSDHNYTSNLCSLLSYYAYTIIGLDKDSFSRQSGNYFYYKAQNVNNIAISGGNIGWKALDGQRNRYWLNENLLNSNLTSLRIFIYEYHINGLDLLQENRTKAIENILTALTKLQQSYKPKSTFMFSNAYYSYKADEIINVLINCDPLEKTKAYLQLSEIDPTNASKYARLKK